MFTHKRAFKLILKIVLVLTAVLLLVYLVISSLDNNKAKTFQSISLESGHSNNSTVILFWNGFFDDNQWTLTADTLNVQCPPINCILTNQHEYLPSIVDYAAIVFHTARPFPLFNGRPRKRAAHQWYVFSQLESPAHTWHNFYEESEFYNLTMSYRLDSDIVWSYNSIRDSATNQVVAPVLKPQWRKVDAKWTQNDSDLLASIKRKKKLAVWFVSNCKVQSKRERLVKQLQAHLNTGIDVYGKCGPLRCARSNSSCYEMLDTDYKFYLSFENSLCIDYVTEKFYNALQRHIVPVVYGGANYSKFAPPLSYIDVQDFKNVSELAAYLIYLDKNPLEYAKYFWWRRHYTIMSFDGGLQTIPYCSLCERVTSHPAMRRLEIYKDINAFWKYNACYAVPRIQF
ncbi:PREDICTED: alpha-(1,3)-fucosyltransferase C-like [Rhagoletis zephyria]|uniref:alpha-(1,3)-fucosyltransferase C-like n=1 Tax=Rhagoletis zephyria TaxID=28612 RepID=UPI000811A692|nr:PREDICTED: alpha-(1,3)-fucosyltransferase C-like [Rhagoletis zephyria]